MVGHWTGLLAGPWPSPRLGRELGVPEVVAQVSAPSGPAESGAIGVGWVGSGEDER